AAALRSLPAVEARRVVDASRPLVDRLLRVRAERSRPAWHRAARGDDALRRLALLYPGHERGERIERVRSGPSAAMVHVGDQEEAEEALHATAVVVSPAHLASDLLVVLDGLEGAERMIGPPVVHDDSATSPLEWAQIRIGCVEDQAGADQLGRVGVEVEGVRVVRRIVEDDVAEEAVLEGELEGRVDRAAADPGIPAAVALRARGEPERDPPPARTHRSTVDLAHRLDLRAGQARRRIRALAAQPPGVAAAGPRLG